MTTEQLLLVLQLVSFIMSLFAIYFSYKIYQFNRLRKAWLAITVAMTFLSIRRFIGVLDLSNFVDGLPKIIDIIDRPIIPFITMTLLVIGLYSMKKSFETFDIVGKKVHEKISNLQKPRKK